MLELLDQQGARDSEVAERERSLQATIVDQSEQIGTLPKRLPVPEEVNVNAGVKLAALRQRVADLPVVVPLPWADPDIRCRPPSPAGGRCPSW